MSKHGIEAEGSELTDKRQKTTGEKPLLVVLPGASTNISPAWEEFLETLKDQVDVVIYRSVNGVKWKWNKTTVSANVDKLCNFLHSHDLDKAGTNNRKWAMLSCSFGGRVMVEYCQEVDLPMPNAETPLIVTGYPWYADAKTRPKDERVVLAKKLNGIKSLWIWGSKDEHINKHAPLSSSSPDLGEKEKEKEKAPAKENVDLISKGDDLVHKLLDSMPAGLLAERLALPSAGHGVLRQGSKNSSVEDRQLVRAAILGCFNITETISEESSSSSSSVKNVEKATPSKCSKPSCSCLNCEGNFSCKCAPEEVE